MADDRTQPKDTRPFYLKNARQEPLAKQIQKVVRTARSTRQIDIARAPKVNTRSSRHTYETNRSK